MAVKQPSELHLFNGQGQEVNQLAIPSNESGQLIELEVWNLPNGSYHLKGEIDGEMLEITFLVNH